MLYVANVPRPDGEHVGPTMITQADITTVVNHCLSPVVVVVEITAVPVQRRSASLFFRTIGKGFLLVGLALVLDVDEVDV